jgi:glycosyltransferase involved in cell wall biosynthesis
MRQGKRIAVVIPAFNAGERLSGVLRALPDGIDECIVVDDGSDPRAEASGRSNDPRVAFVRHDRNRGVGAAILTGYAEARRRGADVAVVMAADGQMDPADLPALLEPVLCGRAVYSKGDRLSHPDCPRVMPPARYAGNCCLTWLTRRVTGRDDLMDSQCGYTALRLDALDSLPLEWLYPRYGFPNDLLAALAGAGLPVAQVVVAPVYRGEPSGLRPALALLVYPLILARGLWVRRLARRYAGAAALDATRVAPRIAG